MEQVSLGWRRAVVVVGGWESELELGGRSCGRAGGFVGALMQPAVGVIGFH